MFSIWRQELRIRGSQFPDLRTECSSSCGSLEPTIKNNNRFILFEFKTIEQIKFKNKHSYQILLSKYHFRKIMIDEPMGPLHAPHRSLKGF